MLLGFILFLPFLFFIIPQRNNLPEHVLQNLWELLSDDCELNTQPCPPDVLTYRKFSGLIHLEFQNSTTYQLCNSAKAALIFFTELSTSSLIITRYLVRETVQRCKSFTDFSIFGPKIDVKKKMVSCVLYFLYFT